MYVATCKTQVRGSGRERKIEAGRESASEQERELLASHSSVAAVELRAWFYHTIQGLHVSVIKKILMMMLMRACVELGCEVSVFGCRHSSLGLPKPRRIAGSLWVSGRQEHLRVHGYELHKVVQLIPLHPKVPSAPRYPHACLRVEV